MTAVLLGIVVVLQAAILVQRWGAPATRTLSPSAGRDSSWWSRLKERLAPDHRAAPPPLTPDTVWDEFRQVEHMHARISRMFEDALRLPSSVSNPPAATGASLDPVSHMQYMRRQIDALFAGMRQSPESWRTGFEDGWSDLAVTPGLGIRDTGDTYEVTVQLPGFDRSAIRVTLEGSLLDIVAERSDESSGGRTNAAWTTRSASRFERRLRLPQAVTRPENVQATYRDDVLRVVVPKARPEEVEQGRVPVI